MGPQRLDRLGVASLKCVLRAGVLLLEEVPVIRGAPGRGAVAARFSGDTRLTKRMAYVGSKRFGY
jgi:hypothetical protein